MAEYDRDSVLHGGHLPPQLRAGWSGSHGLSELGRSESDDHGSSLRRDGLALDGVAPVFEEVPTRVWCKFPGCGKSYGPAPPRAAARRARERAAGWPLAGQGSRAIGGP
jgi:hypothetical protein